VLNKNQHGYAKALLCLIGIISLDVLAGSSLLFISQASTSQTSSSAGPISMGLVQSPVISSLNYLSPTENYFITSELYLPFAAYAFPPLPPLQPILASGWSSNSNYTSWTLNLKQGLKWDDGSPLNSTDLQYTFYLENVTSGFSFASSVTSINIVNSTAIQVTTNTSQPNFIYLYCQQTNSYILPERTFKPVGTNTTSLNTFTNFENIIADGPFVIKNYTQGLNPLVMSANPYYYKGPPTMSELHVYSYSSLSSEVAAYQTGQINALWNEGAFTVISSVFKNSTSQTAYKIAPAQQMGIYFNKATYPFNVTQFRQALAYSTDRNQINAHVNAPNLPLVDYDNLISDLENQIGLNPSTIPQYNYNLTAASNLLNSIGFKKVGGSWQYPNGTTVSINIITADQGFGEVSTATVLESQWKAAGFDVSVSTLSFTSYLTLEESNSGWQVGVELDNPGYYPSAVGNLLALTTGTGDYDGSMDMSLPPVNGVPNWNYTQFSGLLSQAQQYPLLSNQSNSFARQAAPLVGATVPLIPLFILYNWQSLSNNYYWGDPSNNSGVFNTQALVQPQMWYDALWVVKPVSSSSQSSTSSSTASVSSVASSSSSSATSSGSSNTSLASSTAISTTTTSGNSSNLLTYAAVGVVVVIIIAAAAALMMRRRGPRTPGSGSAPPSAST